MYMMFLQGSPWENSVSFLPNSTMVLAPPAELRKASASKGLGLLFAFARLLVFITLTSCHRVHPGGRGSCRTSDHQIAGEIRSRLERFWLLGAQCRRERHPPSPVDLSSSASFPLDCCHAADPKA